jgi:outer membrane lipoprotein-sorting protein
MLRARMILALVILGALFVADTAAAYILPSDFILRMVVEKRRKLGIVDMTVQLTTETDKKGAPIEERIYIKDPERMRRVRQEEGGTRVTVQVEDKAAEGPENALKPVKGLQDLLPVLLQPSGEELEQIQERVVSVLKRLGIDTATVTLGRLGSTVAYVIGGKASDTNKPLLWIDKENFLPLKIVTTQKKDGKSEWVEVRWLEFGSSSTGDWFPRILEVWKDGKRVERSEVVKVEINKKVPDTLFLLP